MKTLKWNVGIMILNLGYKIRGSKATQSPYKLNESIGCRILQFGYWLRGDIPMRTWKWNHI